MPTSPKTTPKDDPKPRARPRVPSRGRGIIRHEALLDATEELLRDRQTDDIGLYQIAEQANIPPASVYHFFPTKEAAFLALARRFIQGFSDIYKQPVDYAALTGWQELAKWHLQLAVDYYHQHPPSMKLFLGRYGGYETQRANAALNGDIARTSYHRLNTVFHMPTLRDEERIFRVNIEIIDAILAISYVTHGVITEAYQDEAHRASVAYCRQYLPEMIDLRVEYQEAMARGDPIVIAYDPELPPQDGHG